MIDDSSSGRRRTRPVSRFLTSGRIYTWFLWMGLLTTLVCLIGSLVVLKHIKDANKTIQQLEKRDDIAVSEQAPAQVAFARLRFLTAIGRLDEALPWLELLAGRATLQPGSAVSSEDAAIAVDALYNMGNARLRHAIELLGSSKTGEAPSSVRLAKDYYVRALRLHPTFWNARYNLDIAARLVRDLPQGDLSDEDDTPSAPKRLWTDLPGLPKGLP